MTTKISCIIFGHEPALAWGWITLGPFPEMELDIVCMKCGKLFDRKLITKEDHQKALRLYNGR